MHRIPLVRYSSHDARPSADQARCMYACLTKAQTAFTVRHEAQSPVRGAPRDHLTKQHGVPSINIKGPESGGNGNVLEAGATPPLLREDDPKPRSKRFITARDVSDLVRRYKAGETTQQIGKHYGISKTRVATVLREQGVAIRRQASPLGADR
jgi:hypothetical protein